MQLNGQNYTVLHNFGSITNDGTQPNAGLTLSGGVLYGNTTSGGSKGAGTIFSMNTYGSAYNVLYNFGNGATDGKNPSASLTLIGSYLYGTTQIGGLSNDGTVFEMEPNGSGYSILYNFNGTNGTGPLADLYYYKGLLYGTTQLGGIDNSGTAFTINPNTSAFTKLLDFTGTSGAVNGSGPTTSFVNINGITFLYGTTAHGGTSNGNIFKINMTFLYGTTFEGGANGYGNIFKVAKDGSLFTDIHDFGSIPNDGTYSETSLVFDGTWLYGTTGSGGTINEGIVFKVKPDGSGYTILHNFGSILNDGTYPYGSLITDGVNLYGTTFQGGSNVSSAGTVFKIQINGGNYTILYSFGTGSNDGASPECTLFLNGNMLYGTTIYGGADGYGTVFKIDTVGANYSQLVSFTGTGGTRPGKYPGYGALAFDGNYLYGTTLNGGANDLGTLYAVYPPHSSYFFTLLNFNGSGVNGNGSWPNGGLYYAGGENFYGTASEGGANGNGCIFQFAYTSGAWHYTRLYSFGTNPDGVNPDGSLYYDGTYLYGTTQRGGVGSGRGSGDGTIFKIKPNESNYSVLDEFTGTSGSVPGIYPVCTLISDSLYTPAKHRSIPNGIVMETVPSESTLKVYPNPSSNNITIDYTLSTDNSSAIITMYNSTGMKVAEYTDNSLSAGERKHTLNVKELGLSEGLYIVTLMSGGTIQTQKVIVTK